MANIKFNKNAIPTTMARRYATRRRPYSRRSRAPTRRRVTPRKRSSYRRTSTRKRPSRKALLNVTSKKKRNGMLTVTTSGSSGTPIAPAFGPAFINATDGGYFLWCATAQNLYTANGPNPVSADAARTAQTCYMRGLSEHIRIQTSSPLPWFHRRICFTTKHAVFRSQIGTTPTPVNTIVPYYDDSARGMERWLQNQTNNNASVTVANWNGWIFKGAEGSDWSDRIIAPVDTTRIDVKFDKTWTLQSGNAVGIVRERKLWHPMNKNLTYDDDESGEAETDTSYYTVADKRGMGDFYILDIIQAGTGGSATDLMRFDCNSTLYWHER
uniref:Capsid protein n=1 Tax=Ficedula parva Genomoviridae sp. TaxID=2814952 RepID=A0A8A4XCX7_9VIRU|nr:MAG: capsid protein [Gemycircularvirus]